MSDHFADQISGGNIINRRAAIQAGHTGCDQQFAAITAEGDRIDFARLGRQLDRFAATSIADLHLLELCDRADTIAAHRDRGQWLNHIGRRIDLRHSQFSFHFAVAIGADRALFDPGRQRRQFFFVRPLGIIGRHHRFQLSRRHQKQSAAGRYARGDCRAGLATTHQVGERLHDKSALGFVGRVASDAVLFEDRQNVFHIVHRFRSPKKPGGE